VYKTAKELIDTMESKLQEKWSPEQISGWFDKVKNISISHETIYRHILADKAANGDLYLNLRRKNKAYQKHSQTQAGRGYIKIRVSIDKRPEIVDEKSRVGDWKIDLVIGKGHSGTLITIVERKTCFTLCIRVNDKSEKTVTDASIALLLPYIDLVKTITADNRKEFAYHEKITQIIGSPVYFADPYYSWQRGLNENTNGLLRQYWPKKTDFKSVSLEEVEAVIKQLNDQQRKKLNYNTPANTIAEYSAIIAA